jgi:hypothetical protein
MKLNQTITQKTGRYFLKDHIRGTVAGTLSTSSPLSTILSKRSSNVRLKKEASGEDTFDFQEELLAT